jgi:hypothetical protein
MSGRDDPVAVAWAAGLYEGEGTAVWHRHAGMRLVVKMTDEDVIAKIRALLGGVVYGPYQYEQSDGHKRKPYYMWVIAGAPAAEVARLLYPHLGERRRRKLDEFLVNDQLTIDGMV